MKKITILMAFFACTLAFSQEEDAQSEFDSIENTLKYTHGTIELKNGVGKITIPKGFKYLDETQARRVIVDLWGNPDGTDVTLGMILPEDKGVMAGDSYAFNIQYDEIGFVKDDDADDIDYDELLATMQKETDDENAGRIEQGYEAIKVVGWATKPFYDKERKILHWAQELKFGEAEVNTLNYNVRILGRKGVLILNAIATTNELGIVKRDIPKVLDIVTFNDGYQYKDFDPSVDEVAAWTIGGLVAGKVLTKVGILAVLAKFGKVIFFALLGIFAAFRNKIRNLFSKKTEEVAETPELAAIPAEEEKPE